MEKQTFVMSVNNSKVLINLLQILVVNGLNSKSMVTINNPGMELIALQFKEEILELRNYIAKDPNKCLDLAMSRIIIENDDLSVSCNKFLSYLCRDVDSGYIPTPRQGATTLLCSHT